MPQLIDSLDETKKTIAKTIITKLTKLLPDAIQLNKQVSVLKNELLSANSLPSFHTLVGSLIEKEKEVDSVFQNLLANEDDEINAAVRDHIVFNPALTPIRDIMELRQVVTQCIFDTKERLSKIALFSKLTNQEKEMLDNFIHDVHELRPIANKVVLLKEQFQERLSSTQSLTEVDNLEAEIITQHESISSLYSAVVSYPEDEKVAGVLIDYLESNHHLLDIMRSFDFYESLMDDILEARAKNTSRLGPT